MPTLHVRNVSESIYKQIQERANAQNCSFSAEVVMLLNYVPASTQQPQKELLAGIRQRRFFKPEAVEAPDTTAFLREGRER